MAEKITGNEPTVVAVGESIPAPSAAQPASSTPGRHVVGRRYEIVGLVGAGGMGTVYRARDVELDEVVALKLLRRDVVDQPGMLDRFRQEVKLARRVTHRNVARTFDIGEVDGEKFLTMEFVEGESLACKIAREGALPVDEVVSIASAICAGLGAAHDAGVVHRDLKPDNVLIAQGGRVAITDFGIARALSDGGRAATVGLALGTPSYMAPEQVEGVRDLDGRADIYALGAMLYECFVGEPPWRGDSVWAIAAARLTHAPPDPRAKRADLPLSAAQLVLRCMARRREDRYQSAADVASALAALTLPAADRSSRPSAPPAAPATMDDEAKAVAVLPFRNLGRPDDDYIAEGLGDDLIDALSMTAGLKVLSRGAVARFRGAEHDAREIGRELRVQVVVDGSVRRAGSVLRVGTRVVGVADGFQLWAKRFDRAEQDLLSVSDEAANAIAEALTLRRDAPARAAPSDPRAIELYLRARHALQRGWQPDVEQAIELFQQALAFAPEDPTILASCARAHVRRFAFNTETAAAEQSERAARELADRALRLSPQSGVARAALAQLKWALGDHVGCARELREALRVAPSSSDVHEVYGRLLLEAGDPVRGAAALAAAAALEPGHPILLAELLRGRCLLGDWSMLEGAVEHDVPTEAQAHVRFFLLGRLVMWRGDVALARALRAKVEPRDFATRGQVLAMLDLIETREASPLIESTLDFWGRVAGRTKRRPAFFRQIAAEVSAFVGDEAKMMRAIEEADGYLLIDLTWLDRCPLFERWRSDGRFRAIRDRVAARVREALDVLEGRSA